MKAVRASALAVPLAIVVVVGGWLAFWRDTGPDAEAGRAWLDGFATFLTSPGLLGARGPGALALLPQLGTWPADGCQATWSRPDGLGPVVVSQSLELARLDTEPCDQAQFGQLTTTLRQSEAVTPGALAGQLTERFGVPEVHRDTGLGGAISYAWDILYGVRVRIDEPAGPGSAATFRVTLTRYLGASAALPGTADGERWLDGAVALLTGPDLPAARGMQAVRMVDAAMRPEAALGGGCATSFTTGGAAAKEPIAYNKWLTLESLEQNCGEARFEFLSLTVWQQGPVTVQALVERLAARLGPAALDRDFARDVLHYQWKTRHGTTIHVSEFIHRAGHDFLVNVGKD